MFLISVASVLLYAASGSCNERLAGGPDTTSPPLRRYGRRLQQQGRICPQWASPTGQGITSKERGTHAPHVFSELSETEMQTVAEFLLSEKSLNLTQLDTIQELTSNHVRINYLHGMWYQIPKKVEVIRHLDQGGPMPKRYARVVLVMGAQSPPVVREVLVDLPKASKLIPVPISGTLGVATLPFWRRPYGFMDEIGISIALLPELDNINAFFKEAFNGHKFHTDDDSATCDKCLQSNNGNYQYLSEALPRVLYTWFEKWVGNGDGAYLHPVPFQMLVVATGENLDRWGIGKVWFNFQSFDSMDALLKEWRAPGSKLKAGWKWVDPTYEHVIPSPHPMLQLGCSVPSSRAQAPSVVPTHQPGPFP